MSSLFERYFIQPLEEEADERLALKEQAAAISGFVSHPYFEKVLERLAKLEYENRTQPGPAENMLYQTGVRDGIEKARLELESLVAHVREFRDE